MSNNVLETYHFGRRHNTFLSLSSTKSQRSPFSQVEGGGEETEQWWTFLDGTDLPKLSQNCINNLSSKSQKNQEQHLNQSKISCLIICQVLSLSMSILLNLAKN